MEEPHLCIVSDTIHSYFNSGIHSGTGGAERQQTFLATELSKRGYNVSIATLSSAVQAESDIDSIALLPVIPDVRGLVLAPYKGLSTLIALQKIGADIYYVRGNDFLSVITAILARFSRAEFVFGVANDSNVDPLLLHDRGLFRLLYRWAMGSATRVIAQTNSQKETLENDHGIHADLIPNGYEMPPSSELVDFGERSHILWVGSMDPVQKKPERFLELARRLPEVEFTMIGPPNNDDPTHYEVISEQAANISNLNFIGYVDPDEIHEFYRTAIALVNTSDYEGFPNVFLEAWRYATPVISLHHPFDGLIESENLGIYTGSMEQLSDSIENLTSDADLCEEIGMNAREFMCNNYTLDKVIEQYDQLFQSLVS